MSKVKETVLVNNWERQVHKIARPLNTEKIKDAYDAAYDAAGAGSKALFDPRSLWGAGSGQVGKVQPLTSG